MIRFYDKKMLIISAGCGIIRVINMQTVNEMDRQKVIVRTSIIGILANVFLAGFKAAVGLISNSISVVLDAVNNLSDALSSVITIIGAKLSNKPADKKHPLGHGRVEYLSALIIIGYIAGCLHKLFYKMDWVFWLYVVNALIQEGEGAVRVLNCHETWHGITYREDMDSVVTYIAALREQGVYPEKLLD